MVGGLVVVGAVVEGEFVVVMSGVAVVVVVDETMPSSGQLSEQNPHLPE